MVVWEDFDQRLELRIDPQVPQLDSTPTCINWPKARFGCTMMRVAETRDSANISNTVREHHVKGDRELVDP